MAAKTRMLNSTALATTTSVDDPDFESDFEPESIFADAERNLRRARERVTRTAFRRKATMSLPDWADKYRRLATSSGNIGGPWRTSRVEVARGPMMAVTERGVRTISAMTCTQLLKTSLLENTLGRFAHIDPCPMLLTQPKEGSVKAFSKERLSPMVRATPVLRDVLGGDRARGGKDTMQFKEFPGGFLALESAGSPTNLAMRAIRITLADEIDKYESTKEGDPIVLLEERTSTYVSNSLHIRTCSPTLVETSRIYKSYLEGDQRRPFVKCPACSYSQTLDFFKHVHWGKNEDGTEHYTTTAVIRCENCNQDWSEAQRVKMMQSRGTIAWKQTKPFTCCDERQEPLKERRWRRLPKAKHVFRCVCKHCGDAPVPVTHASFTVSKLYSPFISIPELAAKWIESKDDPETKQTFYNTQLGQPFESSAAKKISHHVLAMRKENYGCQVPLGVAVLTAGIDVQAGSAITEGRIEVETVGWGRGEESWSIEVRVFKGDPAKPEVWLTLDKYLLSTFDHESGHKMVIKAACIDTGGNPNTEETYKFARARIARNVWAIKGASDRSVWSPVWPVPKADNNQGDQARRTRLTGYKPVIIGVSSAKQYVANKLSIEEPGPGFCHFPIDRTDNWFEQLTSETLVFEKRDGFNTRKWVLPRGRANEALDTRCYAYAALCGLVATRKFNLDKQARMVEQLGRPADEATGDKFRAATLDDGVPLAPAAPERVKRSRVNRSSFVG